MTGIFKQKNPANLLLLLIVGILLKLPMFMTPHNPVLRPADGMLFGALLRFLSPAAKSMPLFFPVITFALLFAQAAVLNRFINTQRMMTKLTYLPGMAYLLITSLLPEWNYFSAPLLINSILLFILSNLFGIYNKQNAKANIFNIGLALGIAGFLFISSLTFVVWILLAMAVMRPFRLNEWLICLLGITTPFYFYAIYTVIDGKWSWQEFIPSITLGVPSLKQSAWLAGSVFLMMVPFLIGGYYVQENLRRMLINVRKGWSLLLLYLLTALLLPFVNTSDTFENWIMAIVPMAAFHACTYLYSTWRVFAPLLFWITTGFVLAYQYYGPGW
ncbi:MAG TPA: hypothetical protein VK644_13705 [Chitinophagaceae bacterium]|nr:hypothetical protein [Chitinophagaceae bacterium]